MIDQTQPVAESGRVYFQKYCPMDLRPLTWGPATTATILQAVAEEFGLQWVGTTNTKGSPEVTIYCGSAGAGERIEVKFPHGNDGFGRYTSDGWVHVSSQDQQLTALAFEKVLEVLTDEQLRRLGTTGSGGPTGDRGDGDSDN